MRPSVAAIAIVTLMSAPAAAQFRPTVPTPGEQYHVELSAVRWNPTPGIVLATDGIAAAGLSGVDLVQEFGFTTRRFTEFRGVVKAGKHKVRVGKVPIAYLEQTQLSRPFVFGGRVFGSGADATADLSWDLWRYGYEYDMVTRSRGFFGIVAELKHNRVKADLSARDGTGTVATLSDVTAPIPTIGFAARVYPHRTVALTAEFTGIKVPGFVRNRLPDEIKVDGSFSDFDISATLSLSRFLGVQAGYRKVATDYLVDEDSGDLSLKGTYLGGVVRF